MEFGFISILTSLFANIDPASFSVAANIATSFPFLVVGILGFRSMHSGWRRLDLTPDLPLATFAFSLVLVGTGSVFYHWSPSTYHLLWDRLPIALCLAALACAMASVRLGTRWGTMLLAPSIIVAASSVLYWYATWARGHEDLRPYAAVQVCAALWIGLVILRHASPAMELRTLRWALAAYAGGRVLELFQQTIYDRVGMDLGHPLKHLLIAFAAYLILRGLRPAMLPEMADVTLQLEAVPAD